MIAVTRCARAIGVVLTLTTPSTASDSPEVAANSVRAAKALPRDALFENGPGRLESQTPYERGKVPVVLIHGLWGSPRNWQRMIEDLEARSVLRTRCQFWTFQYASGDSILYSAHLLRQSLRQARRVFDPDASDAAFDRMVVVGHSLGGILAKMMVQSGGPRLWQTVCARPFDQVALPPEERRILRETFFYKPVPEVRRVIFVATPHRGTPLADGRLRELATRLCWQSDRFRRAQEVLLSHNEPDMFATGFPGEFATSAAELAPNHPLLLKLGDLVIDRSVRSHSVISDLRDPPKPNGTDGIVPFRSAHLDGVASELLIHGVHLCLNSPFVIEEIGRILLEHLGNESALLFNDQLSRPQKMAIPPGREHTARAACRCW
jgi:pimeloyl-ACP methyl ester carboxylesterase